MLDDFVRMRLYRERASEFDLLAETEVSPDVRLRFRTVARHYRDLAGCVEQADKARMAERLEQLRLQRQQAAAKATLPTSISNDAGDHSASFCSYYCAQVFDKLESAFKNLSHFSARHVSSAVG